MTLYNYSDKNKRRTWFLFSGFLIFAMIIGYVFSVAMESSIILYIIVGFSIISSFIAYWFSDKIVLRMSNAKELKFEDNKELYRLVENLCISIGLPLPKIYIINDSAPNAFATGRNPKNAVIAVTTGLLNRLDRSELEGVIAHELSHIKNYDILLATLVTVLVGMIVLMADWFGRWAFFGGARSRDNGKGNIVIIIVAILFAILAPFFAYMMQFAISRKREFLADADGALITRYPDGLARALEKISSDPNELKTANQATAHLYIASPLRGKNRKKGFLAKAFMTHPPTEDRIKALRGMKT